MHKKVRLIRSEVNPGQKSDINFDTGVVAMSEFDSTRPKRVGAPKMGCSRSTPQGVPRRPAVAQSRRPSVLTRSAPFYDVARKLVHCCAARGQTDSVQHRKVGCDCQLQRQCRSAFASVVCPCRGWHGLRWCCQVRRLVVTRMLASVVCPCRGRHGLRWCYQV